MEVTLMRIAQGPGGTFGVLKIDGIPFCTTCEDPWNNNAVGKSCIPPGEYECVPHSGQHFKDVWQLLDVPGRSAILIHAGNTIDDTQGCILVGNGFNMFGQRPGIVNSKDTLQKLRQILPNKFLIKICETFEGD